jgi:hypothetical protein
MSAAAADVLAAWARHFFASADDAVQDYISQ